MLRQSLQIQLFDDLAIDMADVIKLELEKKRKMLDSPAVDLIFNGDDLRVEITISSKK